MRYTGDKKDLERNRKNSKNSSFKKKVAAVLLSVGILVGANIPDKVIEHFDGSDQVKQADTSNFSKNSEQSDIEKDLTRYKSFIDTGISKLSKEDKKELEEIAQKINNQYSEEILKNALNIARDKVAQATKIDSSYIKFKYDSEFQKVYIMNSDTNTRIPSNKDIDSYIACIANLQNDEPTNNFTKSRHANGLWNVYNSSITLKKKEFIQDKNNNCLIEVINLDKNIKIKRTPQKSDEGKEI